MNDIKKYRVLLVHNYYQKPGGEDTVFNNEKKLLEDNGHEVFTYTRDNSEINRLSFLQKILLPFNIIFNIKTYNDVKRIIKENKIDIVHVHNTLCLISPSVFYAAIKMKKPVIQTLHNFRMICPNGLLYRDNHICEDCESEGLSCAIKHKCYRDSFLQTVALVIAAKIHRLTGIYNKISYICLTEFNKQKILLVNNKNSIINERKVYIKPNFVFDSICEDNINRRSIDITKNYKNYYIYVGRLDYIKGVDVVLNAFSKMPNRVLLVIGSGGEEFIKEFSSHTNIQFLGQLPHDQVNNILKKAKALVFASKLYEGLPMTIIESYASSLPVIACDSGNAKELVKDGVTGLHFDSGSAESLINAVNKFEKLDIDKLKKNAREEYFENYNDDTAYDSLIDIYNKILNDCFL